MRYISLQLLQASCLLIYLFSFSDAYDSLDPNGNITMKWDFQAIRDDGSYQVTANLHNYQLYRHIDSPGWKLSWTWPGDDVIWGMWGAEAEEQGDCSRFKGGNIPHSCMKRPVILDMLPGAPYNKQTKNCCRGGVLSSMIQDPTKSVSSFQMSVGTELTVNDSTKAYPYNFGLGLPGYTCSNVSVVPPTKFSSPDTRHITQALLTWQVTCSYSQFRASTAPKCCVGLSTFYNSSIVHCPACSCGCQASPTASQCVSGNERDDGEVTNSTVKCSDHMCPISVHWHLKLSYKNYWRVKVAITNNGLRKNYTDWNLVIQHPNLQSLTQVFSFNYQPLIAYGNINDTGMFWGIKNYNEMLLQAGASGNVQTEMLLQKDPGIFTFEGGWAFPRRILFNGYDCVMPSPENYPSLPHRSTAAPSLVHRVSLGLLPLMVLIVLLFL